MAGEGLTYELKRPDALKEAGGILLGRFFKPIAQLFGASVGGAFVGPTAELIAQFRPEETDAEKGWRLVFAAIEKAVEELVQPLRYEGRAGDSVDLAHLTQIGGQTIDLDRITIAPSFLDNPKTLSILPALSRAVTNILIHYEVDEPTARATGNRLPGYFVFALEEALRQHKDGLGAIDELTKSPVALAARQERAWPHYRARLERDLDAPLFGDPFSLRQLYQPLLGFWVERRERGSEDEPRRKEIRHVVDLATSFDEWVDGPYDPDDALRVVAGGPGSGKSSFVEMWAPRVLARMPALLLPLHVIDSFDLEACVETYAKDRGFAHSPLSRDHREEHLVLILDGLDELDAGGQKGRDAASALVTAAERLLGTMRERGCQLRIVLAGRTVIVDELRAEIGRRERVFHVLPFALSADEKEQAEWKDLEKGHDQRNGWWKAWGILTGETIEALPESIAKNERLADLARQPLLNHLMAIAGTASLGPETSINDVYGMLLKKVWKRGWGPKRLALVKDLPRNDFIRVFETIGHAVWQHGTGRTITLNAVEKIAEEEGLSGQLQAFREGADRGALALMTAFYFREVEQHGPRTFELTHKSFGEYLAARRLWRLMRTLHDAVDGGHINAEKGLRRWYRQTCATRITQEILSFLRGELEAQRLDDIHVIRHSLIVLFNGNLARGMPLGEERPRPPECYRELQRFAAAAELALLAAISTCSTAMLSHVKGQPQGEQAQAVRWSPDWPDRNVEGERHSLWDLLRRLQHDTRSDAIPVQSLTGIDMVKQRAYSWLGGANLEHASASQTVFIGAYLRGANLRGADLCDADLSGADLSHANLSRAHLRSARLRGVHLRFANLSRAHLSGSDLSYADLSHGDLSCANLDDADFSGADVCGANLRGAHLIGANLRGSHLHAAHLRGAHLCAANFGGANLGGADLSRAYLGDARLRGANLSGANLSRAHLDDTDLSGADLIFVQGLTRDQLQLARSLKGARLPPEFADMAGDDAAVPISSEEIVEPAPPKDR